MARPTALTSERRRYLAAAERERRAYLRGIREPGARRAALAESIGGLALLLLILLAMVAAGSITGSVPGGRP